MSWSTREGCINFFTPKGSFSAKNIVLITTCRYFWKFQIMNRKGGDNSLKFAWMTRGGTHNVMEDKNMSSSFYINNHELNIKENVLCRMNNKNYKKCVCLHFYLTSHTIFFVILQ